MHEHPINCEEKVDPLDLSIKMVINKSYINCLLITYICTVYKNAYKKVCLVVLRVNSCHQTNTMAISKTSLFVIFSLLLLSFSVFGERVSFDTPASIKRQVPTGSNPFQSNGRILRSVPSGPNPRESPGTPPSPGPHPL